MSSSDLSEWASEDDGPTLTRPKFKSKTEEAEWERKQRNREYRVAARREKRNRKADEKKQRKLNATILRRMTKNPDKYNKNVDRNRMRDIEMERRKIYKEAVSQCERLAAIHDPTGKMFNVGPVVIQEDGKVVSVELLERRAQAQSERAAKLVQGNDGASVQTSTRADNSSSKSANSIQDCVNPARRDLIHAPSGSETTRRRLSKNQQKKLAMLEERPPPPKPVIPEGIKLPEGEENWLALWDLSSDELERRIVREKKQKAAERKALRERQKEGKAERRAARDERRRVYREKKLEWKAIKDAEKVQKRKLLRVEQEEAKRIEVEVNIAERRRAMEVCAELGFTLENVEGVADIKPKALGMKGREVDFEALEIGNRPSELRIKDEKGTKELKDRGALQRRIDRVDLGKVVDESKARALMSGSATPAGMEGDFVSLSIDGSAVNERQFEELSYNHKLRRKLHRAIEAAQIQKELLVRAKAKEYCESSGIDVPPELIADYKPIKLAGRRILEDGSLETEKQERVRKRLELAEYNKAAKVLRQQAKAEAIEAGLRVFAELTGKKHNDENKARSQTGESLKSIGTMNESVEHNEKPLDLSSKKRHAENEDFGIRKAKKSKKSSDSVPVLPEEATEAQTLGIKSEKMNHTILNTSNIFNAEVASTSIPSEGNPKNRKRKTNHNVELEVDESNQAVDDTASCREKRTKEPKAEGETPEVPLQQLVAPKAPIKKAKKSKQKKRGLIGESTANGSDLQVKPARTNEIREEEVNLQNRDQWNSHALNGNSARKDKFLRLLGGNKIGGIGIKKPAAEPGGADNLTNLVQREDELVRQFDAGVRMKQNGQRKKGLGA